MRILHIGSSYKPHLGGNATRVSTLLEHYSHSDLELFVATSAHPASTSFDQSYYEQTGIRILRIPSHDVLRYRLPAMVRDHHIDVVHAHNFQALLWAALVLPRTVCLVDEIHTIRDSTQFRHLLRKYLFQLWLNRRVAHFFCLSENAGVYMASHYRIPVEKITVTVNGRRPVKQAVQRDFTKPRACFTYGYVGTFYDWQGMGILRDQMTNILKIQDDVRLVLVGDGPAFPAIQQFVQENRLDDRVILPGMVAKEDLPSWYDRIDVFLIPRPSTVATEHSIPLKIFDAVAEGVPIVMSNVRGLTEVLDEKAALIFDAGQPQQLVDCCRVIYRNCALMSNLVKRAAELSARFPTWQQVAELQEQVLLSMGPCRS